MLKRNLGSVAMSLAELIIGILLLVDPVGFTSGIIVTLGIVLMLIGVGSIIRYFRTQAAEAAVGQLLVKGLILLLAGAFCAFNTPWFIGAFPVLTILYGVASLIAGLTKLQWTVDIIRMKRRRWFWTAISAAVSIACGVVVIASPFGTTAFLWMFTGISLIADAVLDMIGGLFGNYEKKATETEEETE